MKRFYIADFETEKFEESAEENYTINPLFINFQEFYEGNFETFILANNEQNEELKVFIKSLCSTKNPTTVYFHNLKFDYKFLMNFLPKDYEYEIKNNSGKILEVCLYKLKKRKDKNDERVYCLKLRDSINLLISSVEKIGKSLKMQKFDTKYYNIEEFNALSEKERKNFIEYGKQDCRIVRKAIYELIQFVNKTFEFDILIDNLPLTLPSLCKKVWLKLMERQMGESYFIKVFDINSSDYEEQMRLSFFGGRTEVFNFNEVYNAVYNDFNGFYAWAMSYFQFPLPPYTRLKCSDSDKCFRKMQKNPFIFGALCEVTENQQYPLIPVRMPNEKVVFANGTKISFLFREEIEYLLDLHQKCKIIEIWICDSQEFIFKEYEEKTYFQREILKKNGEGDSFWAVFFKYFGIQLFGKFAEKSFSETTKYKKIGELDLTDEKLREKIEECGEIHNIDNDVIIVFRQKQQKYTKINIFFAMKITAMCRLQLHKKLIECENNSIIPYYSDTDSVVTEQELENSAELGHLKPELICEVFQALGCKEYAYIDKRKICLTCKYFGEDCESNDEKSNCEEYKIKLFIKFKGFSKVKAESINYLIANYKTPKRGFRPAGFFESLRRNLKSNEIIVFDKQKQTFFDKRWINEDLTTRPFHLQDENFEDMLKNNEKILLELINNAEIKELNKDE